ncbi:MAG TPA: decaprenyl-phosphate phosphoribosyltransferase [Kiritimatiellia bacterium]|nr:decaprenyl-phosphate phosphoribosyltransferase [Kiritimatiellia bacterium]
MSKTTVSLLRAIRPKQWTKNAIVLAPLLFALGDPAQHVASGAVLQALTAAVIFCLLSSGIYVLNDLRDVELDRAHPVKRLRPFAAGELSAGTGRALMAVLLTGGLGWAAVFDRGFALVCLGYVVLQLFYTFGLKRVALVDILIIATGFVLRALAGAVAIHVAISPWLLLCTLLLALFLALCKRRHELVTLQGGEGQTRPSLRAYDQRLLDILIPMIAAATLIAYCLYTLWPDTVAKFGSHKLGFTIPFVVFGLFRYLDLVYRHEQGGRPEQLLLTDIPLLLNIALYGGTVLGLLLWR